MKLKGSQPLATRVANLQTLVTAVTLLVVTLATAAGVSVALSQKTDQQLQSVLGRVKEYAAELQLPEHGLQWLSAEVLEVRPADVRVELGDPQGGLQFSQGEGSPFPSPALGCVSRGSWRICSSTVAGLRVSVGKTRDDDRATLQTVIAILGLLALGATLGVASTSRVVTARSIAPLTELTAKVAKLEPGAGERLGLRSNVSEVDLLGERFDALVARFEEALEREKRFTAEASHELRTPLTLALAEVEALARGEGDGAGPTRALNALNRLAQLAESLLWFARAQGKLVSERTDLVNLADVIRAQCEAFNKPYPEHRFRLSLPDEALVHAEEPLIARALGNLLDNAIKYGDRDEIGVAVERDADSVRVTVTNSGVAIADEARERVFAPFFRSNLSHPEAQGFGLGLPFARAVVRAHGGELQLGRQEVNKTELVLELPLVAWNEAGGEPQSPLWANR
jgi:signal transduction histidine kinase